LLAWEEDSVRECSVLLSNIFLQENVNDKWRWLIDSIHGYTVKGSYRFLTTPTKPLARNLVDDVWHKHIPSKVSLFVWRLMRNRILTKDNLACRCVLPSNDTNCVAGCGNQEMADHLFLGCG
jgi:hypothetical protein